jgi:hypothetical protein
MRFNPRAALVLFTCGVAAACATTSSGSTSGSKNLGDIKVTAQQPLTGYDEYEPGLADFTFALDEGRILLMSPAADPNSFDLTQESNGCLRGTVWLGKFGAPIPASPPDDNVQLRQICPAAPASGDPAGLSRWKDDSSQLMFTAQVSEDGTRVIAESGPVRGEFVLGQGAAADELRKRPQLLAAAFAYGYVPPGKSTSAGALSDYTFTVASER